MEDYGRSMVHYMVGCADIPPSLSLYCFGLRACLKKQWSFTGVLSNQLPQVIYSTYNTSPYGTSSLKMGVVLRPQLDVRWNFLITIHCGLFPSEISSEISFLITY